MENNSISTLLPSFLKIFNNSLESFAKVNEAVVSSEETITINIQNDDNTITKLTIPSFGYLKSYLDRLESNIQAIVNLDGNGSSVRLSDGSYRNLVLEKLPTEAPDIKSLDNVTEFNIKSNWFFENMISPLLYISLDVSDQVSKDTERFVVNRYILDLNSTSKKNYFENYLNNNSNISYVEFMKGIIGNNIQYTLDSETVDLPVRQKRYYGNFDVLKISTNDFTEIINGVEVKSTRKIYKLNKLTYTDKNSGFKDTCQLKIGDSLEVIRDTITTRYLIKSIDSSTNSVILELVEGFDGITIGADVLKIGSENDSPLKVDVSIGYDEHCVVFIKPIDPNSNLASTNWSPGVGFYTNDLQVKDDMGNIMTLNTYYRESVVDFGKYLLSWAEDSYPTRSQGLIPNAPVLNNEDFQVVLINAHVAESPAVQNLKELNNQKNELENRISELDVSISSNRTRIQTKNYSTEVERDADKNTLNALITERSTQTELYKSVVNEILTRSKDTSIESAKPKYHIRGFWAMPEERYSEETGNQAIIKFKIRYRYLDLNGAANQLDQYSYNSGNIRAQATFSNYNIIESVLRERTKNQTTGAFEWANIGDNDPDMISINRMDIPITKGEQVEIQVKSVSEAGYPSNPIESEWSDSIIVEFPTDSSSFNEIESIIEQNQKDLAKISLENDLNSKGYTQHIESSFSTNDNYFAHSAKNIASGFVSENQTPIDLYIKLLEMQNVINELIAAINGLQGELALSLVDSEGNVTEIKKNACTEIFAGYYSDDVNALDDPRGAIVSKTYYINIANSEDTPLRLISKFTGNRTTKVDSSVIKAIVPETTTYNSNELVVRDASGNVTLNSDAIEQRSIVETLVDDGLLTVTNGNVQGSIIEESGSPTSTTVLGSTLVLRNSATSENGTQVPLLSSTGSALVSPLENATIFRAAVNNVLELALNDKINKAFKNFKNNNDNDFLYTTKRRYDQVAIVLTSPTNVEEHRDVKKIAPFQSPQCKNQFIYSRYKDLSSQNNLYSDGMDVINGSSTTNISRLTTTKKYEYKLSDSIFTTSPLSFEWRPSGVATQTIQTYTGKNYLGVHKNHPYLQINSNTATTIREDVFSALNLDISNLPTEKDRADLIFKESIYAVGSNRNVLIQNEFVEPEDDSVNNTSVKCCFETNDQYLLGERSCGCYAFMSPIDHEYIQVDGDSAISYKNVKSGDSNSLNIPVTFQYRMTDYYGEGSGLNGGKGNVNGVLENSTTSRIESRNNNENQTYKKKLGFDIYTGILSNPTVTEFDILFFAKYKKDTFTSSSFTNSQITRSIGRLNESLSSIAPTITEGQSATSRDVTRNSNTVSGTRLSGNNRLR